MHFGWLIHTVWRRNAQIICNLSNSFMKTQRFHNAVWYRVCVFVCPCVSAFLSLLVDLVLECLCFVFLTISDHHSKNLTCFHDDWSIMNNPPAVMLKTFSYCSLSKKVWSEMGFCRQYLLFSYLLLVFACAWLCWHHFLWCCNERCNRINRTERCGVWGLVCIRCQEVHHRLTCQITLLFNILSIHKRTNIQKDEPSWYVLPFSLKLDQ